MVDMPYFMENKEWYQFDYEKRKYVLTEKAPEEAKQSYKEFMKEVNNEVTNNGKLTGSDH